MKKYFTILVLVAVVSPTLAWSQDDGERRPGRRGERGGEGRPIEPGQPNRPGFGPGGAAGPMILMGELIKDLPVMKALDADGDGELSTSEIENASKALMRLDKNGDGKLSTEELRPDPSERRSFRPEGGRPGEGGPQMNGEFLARMFDTRDANKDGKLSGDEIPERMQGMLARVDKDGDGAISKEEMTRASEMMAGRGKGEPGAGRRGEGEEGPAKPKRPN